VGSRGREVGKIKPFDLLKVFVLPCVVPPESWLDRLDG